MAGASGGSKGGVDVLWAVGGRWERLPAQHLEEAADLAKTSTTWFRTTPQAAQQIAAVGQALGLHPLALEDAQTVRQRPKVEDFEGSTFLIVRAPAETPEDPKRNIAWRPVGIFLGDGFVVTVADEVPELLALEERLLEPGAKALDPERLVHRILSTILDSWSRFMDGLEERADALEDLDLPEPDDELEVIRVVKRDVAVVRKVLHPMRDALVTLAEEEHPYVTDDGRIYFRDVADRAVRLKERLDHVSQLATIAHDDWFAWVAHKQSQAAASQNAMVTRLTVLAALLLVPGLIAGVFGMNFPNAPEIDFWWAAATILGATLVGIIYARARGWL